jgi:phosphatidylglycerophosphate synthase
MLDAGGARPARRAPLLLSALRIVLAPLYAPALGRGGAWPFLLASVAAATDFVDGRLARRLDATSRAGAVLDVVADGVFVLAALSALARAQVVSWLLPLAVALALAGYAVAAVRGGAVPQPSPAATAPRRGPADRAGHSAGVVNYALVLAASGAWAGWIPRDWLQPASVAVAVLNLSPLVLRATRSAAAPRPPRR